MIDIEKLINTIYQQFPYCKCTWRKNEHDDERDYVDCLTLHIKCYVCGLEYIFSTIYRCGALGILQFNYDLEADEVIRRIKSEIEIISKINKQKMEMKETLDFKKEW